MPYQPDQFRTGIVRRAYEYWLEKCANGRLPARPDIRPEELTDILPWVFLVDVQCSPVSFRFRLVGSEISRLAGVEYTGVVVNRADYGMHWARIHRDYLRVVQTKQPSYVDGEAPWNDREFLHRERIIMPLSSDGERVDVLFGALHPSMPRP